MSGNITEFLNSKKEQIELSSQRIDLALSDDIKKNVSDAGATLDKLNTSFKNLNDANEAIKKAMSDADKADASAQKIKDVGNKSAMKIAGLLEKVDKSAKDLGVNPNAIDGYKQLDSLYLEIEGVISKINGFTFIA
jgi:DNA repair ATPase RecN